MLGLFFSAMPAFMYFDPRRILDFLMSQFMMAGRLALLAAVVSLTACALAPGQYVKPEGWFSGQQDPEVELIPITARLFATEPPVVAVEDALPAALRDYVPGDYVVGAGDLLYVTVWDHPELNMPAGSQLNNPDVNGRLVRNDGTFYYPYIGAVQAQGRTLEQVRVDMAQRLTRYIAAPQVDVAVMRHGSQKVFLAGAFKRTTPLYIPITQLTLADALSQGEVLTTEADLPGLELIRQGVRYRLNFDRLTQQGVSLGDLRLKAGDSLFLPFNERRKVYVMGEVASQRALPFKTDGISLAEAIASVGGLRQETARARSVYVIRGTEQAAAGVATTVYQLNANSPSALALADRFKLRPGDLVYAGPAQITRWNRFISSLLPSASLLNTASDVRNENR